MPRESFISIHALREEGDTTKITPVTKHTTFLSTPSARRATPQTSTAGSWKRNFYPRPPRGGRPGNLCFLYKSEKFLSTPSARRATEIYAQGNAQDEISIHALREEGDACFPPRPRRWGEFLSTPSARRATQSREKALQNQIISIHALREEGDICLMWQISRSCYFYPRPPRGGRR